MRGFGTYTQEKQRLSYLPFLLLLPQVVYLKNQVTPPVAAAPSAPMSIP